MVCLLGSHPASQDVSGGPSIPEQVNLDLGHPGFPKPSPNCKSPHLTLVVACSEKSQQLLVEAECL